MRKSDDDIKLETLHHCCIHSHMKTYPDEVMEKGQGLDKAVVKGSTTLTSRTGRPGQDLADLDKAVARTTPGPRCGHSYSISLN